MNPATKGGPEVFRIWESQRHFIVLGLSGRVDREVYREACQEDGIPIFRRVSGGGTVLQGPGCLNYALVLRKERDHTLSTIQGTHTYALGRLAKALRSFHPEVRRAGITDLAIDNHKISGNAHRRLHHAILFHGTLLYDFDLLLMERYLRFPDRRPSYRGERSHKVFVRNLKSDPGSLTTALWKEWGAETPLSEWPEKEVSNLIIRRYSLPSWNLRDRPGTPRPVP